MKKLVPIDIVWVDSCGPDDYWRDEEFVKTIKPATVHTRGWLVSETAKFVTIASSVTEDGNFGGLVCVPKFAIRG
jgi:hypothetical protein